MYTETSSIPQDAMQGDLVKEEPKVRSNSLLE